MGESRGVYRVLARKPEGKSPLGKPRYRWNENIKMHLHEVGCEGLDRCGLGKGQVVDTYECVNVPPDSIKCGEFRDYLRND